MEIASAIKEDFVVLEENTPVTQVINKLKQFEKRSALFFRNKTYLGLVEKKKLLLANISGSEEKLNGHLRMTPIVSYDSDIVEIANLMSQENIDYLPVQKDKSVHGVLTSLDVAFLALDLEGCEKWKVCDVKSLKFGKVNYDSPVSVVLRTMDNEKVDQVPLFKAGNFFSVINYKDILRKQLNWSPKRDSSAKFNTQVSSSSDIDVENIGDLSAESFVSDSLLTTSPNTNLKEAVSLMVSNNITSLPIVEGNNFQGMLTINNVLRNISTLRKQENYTMSFVGLNSLKLEELHENNLKKVASSEASKLQRQINLAFQVILHFKQYQKEGNRNKYSVNLRLELPGNMLSFLEEDWDIEIALRNAFSHARSNLEKKIN